MDLYPLLFTPILKEKVWGGRRLARLGKHLPATAAVGESWEVTDLPGDSSRVANGPLAGRTLRWLMETMPEAVLGAASPSPRGGFPLLIKYLDARENLSVQVHPDEAYARAHPEAHLKSEAWYVVEAEPGSVIYKGVRSGTTAEQFARHIRAGTVTDDLVAVPAIPGDCHYLPSGTCHALGAGVLVAEVQTPSDTTFRVYDWNRLGRDLHIEQALACMDFRTPAPAAERPPPVHRGGIVTTPLTATGYFALERVDVPDGGSFPIVTNGLPEVWMVIDGSGRIDGGRVVDVPLGATVLLPAAAAGGNAAFPQRATLLRVTLPSPMAGQIARA